MTISCGMAGSRIAMLAVLTSLSVISGAKAEVPEPEVIQIKPRDQTMAAVAAGPAVVVERSAENGSLPAIEPLRAPVPLAAAAPSHLIGRPGIAAPHAPTPVQAPARRGSRSDDQPSSGKSASAGSTCALFGASNC